MFWLAIDRSAAMPLVRQIYLGVRSKILQGELRSGDRLPSTRNLARELHVSRNVVIEAYDYLLSEGYIESRRGSGNYVAEGVYLEQKTDMARVSPQYEDREQATEQPSGALIDFRSGIPALELFPRKTWGRLSQQVCKEASAEAFGYGKPAGSPELRTILCKYLQRSRGVCCDPRQIVITSGATQALSLIAKVLLTDKSTVVIEDPITHDIQTIFTAGGASLYPVPIDENGMKTELLPPGKRPGFVFVTPSHQFPLGGTLPIQRRLQLIRYACSEGCYIVEDDYDSEFRYEGPPISSIQGLDRDRVIYIGSFSKILSPALRLGYLVLPAALVERYQDAKWFTDLHTPTLEQLTLGRFIEEGQLERHVANVKKLYKKRRDCLRTALHRAFPGDVSILGSSTGLHFVAAFPGHSFTAEVVQKIREAGVRAYPVEDHTIVKGQHRDKIILGFGNVTEGDIEEGVHRLRRALANAPKLPLLDDGNDSSLKFL